MADGDTWDLLLDREREYHEVQPVVQEEGNGWVRYQDGRKYHIDNRLNRLDTRRWLKFQKSWFIHKPRPRKSEVKLHPAKYPEELIAEFIEFFTKPGMTVLDPMLGTGSSLLAALETGRSGVGIELQPKYAAIAHQRLEAQLAPPPPPSSGSELQQLRFRLLQGDAFQMAEMEIGDVDYCITSPPYWDMLRAKGSETQKTRKEAGLDVHYSEDENDLGNLEDYDEFVTRLAELYRLVHRVLRPGAYLTVIAKNVKKRGRMYPLAWDLARELSDTYILKDEKIWCQDDITLAPYGYRYAWVSNTFHQYCLNFQKEK